MNNHRYCRVAPYIPIAAYTKRGLVARQEMETEGLNCVQIWKFCILNFAFGIRHSAFGIRHSAFIPAFAAKTGCSLSVTLSASSHFRSLPLGPYFLVAEQESKQRSQLKGELHVQAPA